MSEKLAQKKKSIIDLGAGDCRWPIGDPRGSGFHFCGAQQTAGRPYCAHHLAQSFDQSRARPQSGVPAIRRAA